MLVGVADGPTYCGRWMKCILPNNLFIRHYQDDIFIDEKTKRQAAELVNQLV